MSKPDYTDLIAEAEAYCAEAGIKLSSLGLYAVGSSRWFDERKAGRPCLTTTADRVRRYIADKRAERAANADTMAESPD